MKIPGPLLANLSAESREPVVIGLLIIATFIIGALFVVGLVMAISRKSKSWTFVCIAAGLLAGGCLVGAGVMLGRVIGKQAELAKTGEGPKRRTFSADKSYSIEVPKDWKASPKLNEDAGITSAAPLEGSCVMVLADTKADFAGNLEEFDNLTIETMKGALESPQVSEPKNRMFGAFRGIERRITGRVQNLNLVYHRASIETSDGFYQIIAWTSPSREKQELPTFQKIFESFNATAGPATEITGGPTEIGTRTIHVVSEVLGVEVESIKHESRLVADLGADDLDAVEIVMAIKEEFGIEVPDEQAEKLVTVGDLIRWLEQKAAP